MPCHFYHSYNILIAYNVPIHQAVGSLQKVIEKLVTINDDHPTCASVGRGSRGRHIEVPTREVCVIKEALYIRAHCLTKERKKSFIAGVKSGNSDFDIRHLLQASWSFIWLLKFDESYTAAASVPNWGDTINDLPTDYSVARKKAIQSNEIQ